jgi:hypothetical protein
MYCIHDYITDPNPIRASEDAFEGIRCEIRINIKRNILKLKSKYLIEQALQEFTKILISEETFQILRNNTNIARTQLMNEYNNDPLMESAIIFDLENEIESLFREQWKFTPKFSYLGKQHPAEH